MTRGGFENCAGDGTSRRQLDPSLQQEMHGSRQLLVLSRGSISAECLLMNTAKKIQAALSDIEGFMLKAIDDSIPTLHAILKDKLKPMNLRSQRVSTGALWRHRSTHSTQSPSSQMPPPTWPRSLRPGRDKSSGFSKPNSTKQTLDFLRRRQRKHSITET